MRKLLPFHTLSFPLSPIAFPIPPFVLIPSKASMTMSKQIVACAFTLASLLAGSALSFSPQPNRVVSSAFTRYTTTTTTTGPHYALEDDSVLDDIGYRVAVEKPLGVIFGENDVPYKGLVLDDIEPGLNGGAAGLRVGDQLLSVNGQSVVGADFDSVMNMLVSAEGVLELQLYRGNVRTLYTIMNNMRSDTTGATEQDDDEEDVEAVVMDENYESPVVINVEDYEDKPLTPGDVVNAFKNLGTILMSEESGSGDSDGSAPKEEKKKSGGGLFGGMFGGGETIQLEGEDASSGQK